MAEALALDVVRDPGSALGATLDRFAGAFSARYGRVGGVASRAMPNLLQRIEARWSPAATSAGLIEVYDGADFGSLVREWSVRSGYEGDEYRSEIPFVIPVDPADPMAQPGGLRATRRPDPRAALRPVAVRPAPATAPRAREQWRPAAARTVSPYPPALGQAGAVNTHLLRFPAARAEVATEARRAVVEDQAEAGIAWGTPSAALLADHIEARLAPTPAPAPIAAWLAPAGTPTAHLAERGQAPAGRWAGPALPLVARAEPVASPPEAGRPGTLAERLAAWAPGEPRRLELPEAERTWVAPSADAAQPGETRALSARSAPATSPGSAVALSPRPAASEAAPPVRAGRPTALEAARQDAALPWRTPATDQPFVPGALAQVALALGQAFERPTRATQGWSALEGLTFVQPTAPASAPTSRPTRSAAPAALGVGPGRAVVPVHVAPPPASAPPAAARVPAAEVRAPSLARREAPRAEAAPPGSAQAAPEPLSLVPRSERGPAQDPAALARALERGLALLTAAPAARAIGPAAAELPALARPFALAATLPETHREPAPAATVGALTFGERLAATAARTEVALGLTVASSPAGSLDAPWFAADRGTLLVPVAPTAASATAPASAPAPADRAPQGRVVALPPLAIAVDARHRAEPSAGPGAGLPGAGLPAAAAAALAASLTGGAYPARTEGTGEGVRASGAADAGAHLPLRFGALDATYVVPTGAPDARPTSGAERATRFADAVVGGARVVATPEAAPRSTLGGRPEVPLRPAPGLLAPHPALASFAAAPAAPATRPTLGERLAQSALVAFQMPAAAERRRTLDVEAPTAELVVPAAEVERSPQAAARARADAQASAREQAAARAEAPAAAREPAARTAEADRPTEPSRPAEASRPTEATPPALVRQVETPVRSTGYEAAEATGPATGLRLIRQAAAYLDITGQADRVDAFVRWVTGEAAAGGPVARQLEAAGVIAPGALVQPAWRAAFGEATDAAASRTTRLADAVDGLTWVAPSAAAATAGDAIRTAAAPAPEPASRVGITAWPAAVDRLLAVWRAAEATVARSPGAPSRADAAPEAHLVAAPGGWPEPTDGVLVAPPAPAATHRAGGREARLPGATALEAAGLGTRLATRRFEELIATATPAQPMISGPVPSAAPRSRVADPSVRETLVAAGMASGAATPAEDAAAAATAAFDPAQIGATQVVWPALVAPAVGADEALGATEAWVGSAPPAGAAAPLNFERALLTWNAAAIRDAESRVAEARPSQALGPLGHLVRQNALVMGPRTVDVPMRAAPGGSLFGDRGPAGLVAPDVHAQRVLVDPSARAAEQALRSTPGERPTRDSETSEEAQHRLADQVGEEISPEETERLAREIISRLKRELEFDAARLGDDAWD